MIAPRGMRSALGEKVGRRLAIRKPTTTSQPATSIGA